VIADTARPFAKIGDPSALTQKVRNMLKLSGRGENHGEFAGSVRVDFGSMTLSNQSASPRFEFFDVQRGSRKPNI
jgi:hypothetical protein